MNYYEKLYGVTAMLLLLQYQMKDSEYAAVISRYISDSRYEWQTDALIKAVESLGILLSLERNAAPMPLRLINELEHNISAFDLKALSDGDRAAAEGDLRTAGAVIDWYKTTPGKMI